MWIILLIPTLLFSLGLQELWKSALKKNPEILAQKQDIRAKEYKLKATKNLYFPLFEAQYSRAWLSEKQKLEVFPFSFDMTKKNYENYSISLKELLYDFGRREKLIDISVKELKVSQYFYEEKKQEILYKVAENYFNVLSVKGKIRIYEEELKAVKSQYQLAKAYYEKGLVAITDLLQAKVRIHEVKEKIRKEKGNLETLLVNLSNLTGIEKEKLRNIQEIEGIPEIKDLSYYLKTAYERRGILKAQKEKVKILENLARIKALEYAPQIFGGLTYYYTNQNPNVEPKGLFSYYVGATLSFQTLKPYYEHLSLKREKIKALKELESLENSIKLQVKSAYEDVLTAKENLKTAKERLKFAKKYYELALEQYKNQLISQTDLLIAEATLTSAKEALLIAKNELWKAYYRLLWASSLLEVER
ncbi:TolC family protein [Aquifex aeolicus]|uniref:Outer membrane efflux protein n=1 Tax=Aquifex aeolicus (strain VF5) TaxID=224324 RepID=O67158_AQUAE|nr:TolC family protein [Aquifex aeolicus]AAC07128.1 putative protein [Aquifex aeolicus VF5]